METMEIRIAIPNKGRLSEPSLNVLDNAGLRLINGASRRLTARTVDPEIKILFARAMDIPEYVCDEAASLGITGLDLVKESGHSVEPVLDLGFGNATLVVASPTDSDITGPGDLEGCRVATEFPRIAREYFESEGINVDLVVVSGACELTPHVGVADAIVDLTSSGNTLRMNSLAPIATIMETSAHLIVNPQHKDIEKVQDVIMAVESVIRAEDKRYVMMNVPEDKLGEVKEVMPGLAGPTVMRVEGDSPMVAVHVVVDEREVFQLVARLKRAGARDVLVVPIERMIL